MASDRWKHKHRNGKGVKSADIRECASLIFAAIDRGADPADDIKRFSGAIKRHAWRLIMFEGLVSRVPRFEISKHGRKHIDRHGHVIYPPGEKP